MNRTVGVTLRRAAGGSIVFAFGFGALASAPASPEPVVTASSTPAPVSAEISIDQSYQPNPINRRWITQTQPPPFEYIAPVEEPAPPPPPKPAPPPAAQPRLAVPVATRSWSVGAVSGAANGFSFGSCTWWIAHKRYVPWRGNAAEWWWNARAFGAAEGSAPRAGAIMVMGISGSSPLGHVAYVESVNANRSFLVSEMNWWGVPGGGWDRVDYRTVTSMAGVLGFIY